MQIIDMKNLDLDMLFYLFINFAGGADIDDDFLKYGHLNLEKVEDRKIIINELKNHYVDHFDDFQKKELRTLLDRLIKENINIDRQIDNQLYPFYFPRNKQAFFIEIKKSLGLNEF